jgi:hypothetical protein
MSLVSRTKKRFFRASWVSTTTLVAALLLGSGPTAMAQPQERDHRQPKQAPPPPQAEQVKARPGYVWVEGHYEYRGDNYVWVNGHWERARKDKRFRQGRWVLEGDYYVWTPGGWEDLLPYPTKPPPAPREERVQPRRGFIWVAGHYDWRDGEYVWVEGSWERERGGKRWRDGRWDNQGGRYVWNPGDWEDAPQAPQAPQYPTQPPPGPRDERVQPRNGYVWVSGAQWIRLGVRQLRVARRKLRLGQWPLGARAPRQALA